MRNPALVFLTLLLMAAATPSFAERGWIDISLAVSPGRIPTYPGDPGIDFEWAKSLERGDIVNLSDLHFGAHSGTHIDAPLHFIKGGRSIDRIPLDVLVGPALVIECSRSATVIDRAELARHHWRGARRILFKTRNSYLGYIADPSFHRDFTAIAPDAARLLRDAGVVLVGLDYISVERFGAKSPDTHRILLGANVVIVEGLDLRAVRGGDYDLVCLPARLAGREAAPTRAIIRPRR